MGKQLHAPGYFDLVQWNLEGIGSGCAVCVCPQTPSIDLRDLLNTRHLRILIIILRIIKTGPEFNGKPCGGLGLLLIRRRFLRGAR